MTGSTPPVGQPAGSRASQFDIVTIAMAEYRHHSRLDGLVTEAKQLVELLEGLGGTDTSASTSNWALDLTSVNELLATWAAAPRPRSSVLVWQGHGEARGNEAWLATHESRHHMRGTAMSPAVLAEHLVNEWRRRCQDETAWTLVVIEACGANSFVRRLAGALLDADPASSPQRLAIVGVGGDGANYLGEFRRALTATLASYTDNDKEIGLTDLISRLEDRLDPVRVQHFQLPKHAAIRNRRIFPGVVAAPLDIYSELREFLNRLTPDERSHFVHKAQGAEHGEMAWYFTGRRTELRTIADWLDQTESGLLIVTGRAGSGKSALLGNVLVHTNPRLRDLLKRVGQFDALITDDGRQERQLPPFDAVVHLTGLTTADLVTRVSDAAGIDLPPASVSDIDFLLDKLRDRPFLLLADGLDEAQEPTTVASSVLRRLATLPNGRVVVGTRASIYEGPDRPDTTAEDLLDALGRASNTRTVVVDSDADSIAEYVRRRIRAFPAIDRIDTATINEVATLIAGHDRQFLYARLAVHEVLAQPQLLDLQRRNDLDQLLRRDHRALFEAAVQRLAAAAMANDPLLEALSLGRGRGLPRADRIWAVAASALGGQLPITEADIDNLLCRAQPYIMLDAEDGQSVYRLAHQCFREFFEARSEQVNDQATTTYLPRGGPMAGD